MMHGVGAGQIPVTLASEDRRLAFFHIAAG